MHVAHEHDGRAERSRLEQVVSQHGIHHGRFVHHEQPAGQRVILVAGEPVVLGRVFEQAVDRAGFPADGLGHALRRPARGRGQQNLGLVFRENLNDRVQDGGLARTGAAGQDHYFGRRRCAHGLKLFLGQRNAEPGHDFLHHFVGLGEPHRLRRGEDTPQVIGNLRFVMMEPG